MSMMHSLLQTMATKRASDLFISVGSFIQLKINGAMHSVSQQRVQPHQVEKLLREVISAEQWDRFLADNELNIGYGLKDVGSFRFSVFKQRGSPAAVIRYIPSDIPAFDTLGLPPILKELIIQPRGLFLMVGATGTGKSTTLASLLDYRNANCTGHILTLEDPIEFVFRNQMSIVNQRSIGQDAKDLRTALKNALRQAPDCILIGEIRDLETMGAAIAYAQSGHLVLATLHANNASHALNRILTFYQPENRGAVLVDLASTLKCVVSQRLLHATDGGRVPAVEVLINTNHVAELIETNRLSEVPDAINNSMAAGSQSFERSLIQLLRAGRISKADALQHSDSPTNLLWMLDNVGEEQLQADDNAGTAQLALPDALQKQAADFSQRPAASKTDAPARKTLADFDAEPVGADPDPSGPAPTPAPVAAPLGIPASAANNLNPPSRIFAVEPPPSHAKHGTLPPQNTPPAAPVPAPASPAPADNAGKPAGPGSQGASFADFFIKLD